MKRLSSYLVAPSVLAVLSILAGCSSSDPVSPAAGGSSAGGKPGTAGASAAGAGGSIAGAGGAGAGGTGGSPSAGGAGSGGANTAGAAGGLSSAGSGGAPVAAAMTFTSLKGIIMVTCFGNGCHSQEGNHLQMKLDDTLYTTLTTYTTQFCGKLVNTTTPAESALLKVLKGDCGTPPNMVTPRMPYGICFDGDTDPESPCIQPDKIAGIQAWIAKGAPKD